MPAFDRPLPFVVRVATEWHYAADLIGANDEGILFFRERAQLTGHVLTSGGNDVQFSDVGLEP